MLGWPRRSLFSIKVVVGVTSASLPLDKGDACLHNGGRQHYSPDLTLRYFCAYSAHCVWVGDTWGVAPGYKLLRFQRVLIAEASPPHPKFPQIYQRPSFETKISVSTKKGKKNKKVKE